MKIIKRIGSGVAGVIMLILLVMAMTGKFDDDVAQISGADIFRGNDTGPTMADNSMEVIEEAGEPDNAEQGVSGDVTETAAEEPETASLDQPASLEDIFAPEKMEEDVWWAEDKVFAWIDTETGEEIDVKLHWAAEDLGEIRIDLSDGSSTGDCVFETDGMWSYFTYNGQEAQFYLDEEDGAEVLHLILGEDGTADEIVLVDLEWLQKNAG